MLNKVGDRCLRPQNQNYLLAKIPNETAANRLLEVLGYLWTLLVGNEQDLVMQETGAVVVQENSAAGGGR